MCSLFTGKCNFGHLDLILCCFMKGYHETAVRETEKNKLIESSLIRILKNDSTRELKLYLKPKPGKMADVNHLRVKATSYPDTFYWKAQLSQE